MPFQFQISLGVSSLLTTLREHGSWISWGVRTKPIIEYVPALVGAMQRIPSFLAESMSPQHKTRKNLYDSPFSSATTRGRGQHRM